MKPFDQFIYESTSEEDREDSAEKEKFDAPSKRATHKIVSRSFRNAMKALQNGDIQRHRYWMQKAYHKLTGTGE
jgi:hypothetical protein